ncbi:radical SAM protein [Actinocrinis puniceicyclus]
MACPSSCGFCFSAGYRAARTSGRLMATDLIKSLLQAWAAAGVRLIRFDGGGDPLSHPDLPALIEHCDALGLRTAVLTAGDLLAPRQFAAFIRARTYMRISLNAATDATRAALHGTSPARHGVRRILDTVAQLDAQRRAVFGDEAGTLMPLGATSMIHPGNATSRLGPGSRHAPPSGPRWRDGTPAAHFHAERRHAADRGEPQPVQPVPGRRVRVPIR